jgi:hypothetical protein
MNYSNMPLVLLATGFLVAGHSSPLPPSFPRPQDEVLRLVAKGQFAEARQVVAGLIEDARTNRFSLDYEAGLWRLLGSAENTVGRYKKRKQQSNRVYNSATTASNLRPNSLLHYYWS